MRLTVHLPLLLLCALSIAACTSGEEAREGDDRRREFWVGHNVQGVNEQVPPKVQCPDDVNADEGGRYRCVAKAQDGTSVAVNVVQPHDESSLSVSTKVLETRKVEMRLRHGLDVGRPSELSLRDRWVRRWYASYRVNVRRRPGRPPDRLVLMLDCQDLVEVKKGAHFTCKGTTAFFPFTVRVTFTNDRGKFTYTARRT